MSMGSRPVLHRGPLGGRDLKNAPFWLVILVEAAAVAYTAMSPQHWLRAVGVMALGLFVAGAARLVLNDEQAGLLRVRGRSFDVFCYVGFGALALIFGLALPQR
jgi:hypothetical protein